MGLKRGEKKHMPNVRTDMTYAAGFIPAMKRLVGPLLIEESELLIDRTQAADLVVLMGRDIRIGCRVRRPGYADRYPHEFTLRAHRESGAATELEKITNGWGDWLLYGHDAGDGRTLSRWMVIDLHAWRAHLIRHQQQIKWGRKSNGDGTEFVWFDVRSFSGAPPILVAHGDDS